MTNTLSSLSIAQLQQVISIKEQIEALERQLADIVGAPTVAPAPAPAAQPEKRVVSAVRPSKQKGQISAAGRAAIVAAQKARWAKVRAAKAAAAKTGGAPRKPVAAPKAAAKPKISPEGIARIIAATKARWARINAAKAAAKKR